MATGWDRVAPIYGLQLGPERRALGAALEMGRIGPEDRLLDLGTGTGALLNLLAERPGAPRRAIGVDRSAAMVAAVGPLPGGWELSVADACRLPFASDGFEVVTAAYLLHLLGREERRAVLAEAARVLVPGGRLVTVTIAAAASGLLAPLFSLLSRTAGTGSGPAAGMRALDPRPELLAAGFIVRGVRRVRHGYPSLVVEARVGG